MFDRNHFPTVKGTPVAVSWGELSVPIGCCGCKSIKKAGIIIQIGQEYLLVCPTCQASGIYKYQSMNPNEAIIQTDVRIECPDFKSRLGDAIKKNLASYKISSTDVDRLVYH